MANDTNRDFVVKFGKNMKGMLRKKWTTINQVRVTMKVGSLLLNGDIGIVHHVTSEKLNRI